MDIGVEAWKFKKMARRRKSTVDEAMNSRQLAGVSCRQASMAFECGITACASACEDLRVRLRLLVQQFRRG